MSATPLFPNYLQLSTRLSIKTWHVLRVLSVISAISIALFLFVKPALALPLFWSVIVPVLPALFWLAPGIWRNVCPMAALNQTPRLLGITKGLTHTPKIREYSYVLGIALFFILVSSRKWLFDGNGWATGGLILFGLCGAFIGGLIFKGKSGWCSSICPMLPVQRIYGQTPALLVANAHCQPCVGCTKNCYDFNPGVAYLADQYDSDKHYVGYRRVFVGILPGFILAFFCVAKGTPTAALYLTFALYSGLSLALFHLLDTFLKLPNNRLTVIFGAAALNLYYFFAAPNWFRTLSHFSGHWSVPAFAPWLISAAVAIITLWWIARSFQRENEFLMQSAQHSVNQPAKLGVGAVASLQKAGAAASTELLITPDNTRIPAQPNQTLLELIEGCGAKIESGCRMGVCGADPIAVTAGMDCLSPISDDEQNTLARLGFAPNTRLACSARLRSGSATIALVPEKAQASIHSTVVGDPNIKHVVIIGNGIAGVTAADHVRRLHPDCSIQIVANENHQLYNRMGITRLIYGRSAMQGLYLMPDSWYVDRQIEVLLNTAARSINTEAQQVILAEGDALPYDRLILATGSRSFVPPLEGYGGPGCFVLRSANDAMGLRAYVQQRQCQSAVVAGGGLLGLEAAYALHKLGVKVSVIERNHWLLHRQLDEAAGKMLQRYLQSLGLEIVLNAQIQALDLDADGTPIVRLGNASTLRADVFVVAAGIAPNTELAQTAGLTVERAIVVDDHMQTSVPHIYAVGDAAQHAGANRGLWAVAVEQAEVAASNAMGKPRLYQEPVLSTVLKVVGADVISVGQYDAKAGDEAIVEEDIAAHRYRKLVLNNGHLKGAILIGWPELIEPVSKAVKANLDLTPSLEAIRAGHWKALQHA